MKGRESMLCQNCGKNEASIHLYASVNGQRKQLDYCQSCYQKLKAQSGNAAAAMAQDPFGFGNIDDLFRQMSRQMQQGNTPYEQTLRRKPAVTVLSAVSLHAITKHLQVC